MPQYDLRSVGLFCGENIPQKIPTPLLRIRQALAPQGKIMPHTIYYSTVLEHLFLLEQLAHASQSSVTFMETVLDGHKEHDYSVSEVEVAVYGFQPITEGYWDSLNQFVSDYLIQCATRTRIIQDLSDFSIEDKDYCPDKEAFNKYPECARVIEGKVSLSLRECCNKIIHAKALELPTMETTGLKLQYWGGTCLLSGSRNRELWKIAIDIKLWVLAMRDYYSVIQHL